MSYRTLYLALVIAGLAVMASCSARNGGGGPAVPGSQQPGGTAGGPGLPRLIGSIHLPGAGGFTDYLVVDPATHRLYAGYASENKLVVVDTDTNSVIAEIGGLVNVRSVALVPAFGLGFTTDRSEDEVGVIDLNTNSLVKKIPGGNGPDAIVYDELTRLVYVADHEGSSATLIDPSSQKVVATIPLGGTAEYAQVDPKTGLVYQNLESASEIVVVDTKKKAVVARYKTAPGENPTGLAFDTENHRLFSACGNGKLVILDSRDGKLIDSLPIGADVDFAAYDRELHRVYTANGGSGTMTVIRQESADKYAVLGNVPAHQTAHALALDPVTHKLYVTYGGSEILVYDSGVN